MRVMRPITVPPVITQPFGPTEFQGEPAFDRWPHFHQGVDYAVPIGTPVLACAAGVVMPTADTSWGYGTHVRIDHGNGTFSLYGHLSQVHVTPGQHVIMGQAVASSGNTGNSTGPHLHWSIYTMEWYPLSPAAFLF